MRSKNYVDPKSSAPRGKHFAPPANTLPNRPETHAYKPARTQKVAAQPRPAAPASQLSVQRPHKRRRALPILITLIVALALCAGAVYGFLTLTSSGDKNTPATQAQQTSITQTKAPTITLAGDADMTIQAGTEYTEPGFTAQAYDGSDLTSQVQVNSINTLLGRGDYTLTYKVSDASGQTAEATRTVHVQNVPAQTGYTGSGVAVLMYHDVFDAANPPADVNNNMIENTLLKEHIDYFVQNKYYFPTWQEVRDYVDGKIQLPQNSVCMTFDDGSAGFEAYGVPLISAAPIRATAFIIASADGQHWHDAAYKNIDLQSHSYDMHKAGGSIGHGGILTALTHDQIVADLRQASQILGTHEAFAYPFGDTDANSGKAVQDAGYLVAFTTQPGKVQVGDNPYYLPRVRVFQGESAKTLAASIQAS